VTGELIILAPVVYQYHPILSHNCVKSSVKEKAMCNSSTQITVICPLHLIWTSKFSV
jgi:hypothetical protein